MASPQIENGYTRIANELMEAFAAIRIPGEARQVVDVIIRKTYGYNKKNDYISLSQFANLTGMKRPTVARALKKALLMGVIKKDNTYPASYCINKDFSTWKVLSKKITVLSKKIMGVIKKDNLGVIKKDTYKRNNTKDNNTKEIKTLVHSKMDVPESFIFFWKEYPKRVGRTAAMKAWSKLSPSADLVTEIMAALQKHKENNEWTKNNGQYIPHPTTWLNGRRWEDELSEGKTLFEGLTDD